MPNMSQEAINFKKKNSDLNFKNMSIQELNQLPPHNGVINYKLMKTSFSMLNIYNDDSSVVKYFWNEEHDLNSLNLWYEISRKEGIYIDIGAHTGMYTMTSVKANSANKVISIEPYYLNMARLITNLRLNQMVKNVNPVLVAVSNIDTVLNFNINTDYSYLSKGGKIDTNGIPTKVIKLDSLDLDTNKNKILGIKIDTEGEDFKVLEGSQKLIEKFRPKIIIEVRENNKKNIKFFLESFNYDFYIVNDLNEKINLENLTISNVLNIYAKPK